MNNYRKYTCPACQGKGCRLCQNKGTVYLTPQQLQRVKSILQKMPQPTPMTMPASPTPPTMTTSTQHESGTKKAGLLTILALALLVIGGGGSYAFFKSLKPFFAGLITLALGGGVGLLWNNKKIKPTPPNDFITALDEANKKTEEPEDFPQQNLPPAFPF